MSEQPFLRLRGVGKHFGDHVAVHAVDLDIARGEFVTLLGPSGCGKTTLLRMIAGFEQPSTGMIELEGSDLTRLPPDRRPLNMVFQSYALFPHMNVYDNVAYGLRTARMSADGVRVGVRDALELVGLERFAKRRVQELSGGMSQRVALARAIVNEPSVLLLDEPLGALDLQLRKRMQVELRAIQDRVGTTFIYVTHDQEEALVMSDRLVVMRDGHIEQLGYPEDVYERPATRFVAGFIGTSNIFDARVRDRIGDNLVLDGPEGDRIMVPLAAGATLGIGDPVAVTVRPEKLTIVGPDDVVGEQLCSVGGTITEVVYQGVSTQYIVRTDAGDTIVAFRQNSERVHDVGVPGSRARLVWDPQHNVVLTDGADRSASPSEPQQEELVP
jgi:spermidine/putrescine transport system ATP-binding protein